MLYFSTDGCINKSLTYLLTYLLTAQYTRLINISFSRQIIDVIANWRAASLILNASLIALANCKLLSCSMCTTVDGIHRSVLIIWHWLQGIQDGGVLSGLLHYPVEVCSHWFQFGSQRMLASLQSRSLRKRHYLFPQRNEPVPTEQDLSYNSIRLVNQLFDYFDCFIESSVGTKEPLVLADDVAKL